MPNKIYQIFQADPIEMPTECKGCEVLKVARHGTGESNDLVTSESLYSDYQIGRLRKLGPRIYSLRTLLWRASPEDKEAAQGWIKSLDIAHREMLAILHDSIFDD